MNDPLTTPVGTWAPAYATRIHHMEPLVAFDVANPDPDTAAAFQAWEAPGPARDVGGAQLELPRREPANADPYAFAGHSSDLTGYPRTYIENAEFDDLRASGEAFGRQLADAGADVTVVTAAGLPHGYLNVVGSQLTYASLDRISAVLRAMGR